MASHGRSVRVKKGPANYSVESSDDDDDGDPKTRKAKKKLKEMMQEDSDAESDFEKELPSLLGKRSHGQLNLNLSESDSSDEESVSTPTKVGKKHSPALKSSYFSSATLGDNTLADEDADASQRLVALADNLEAVKNVWKDKGEGNMHDDHKKSLKPGNLESSFDLEISTLLAQGEGDSMEDIDPEDVNSKPAGSESKPRAGVEVMIAMPDNQRRKKQKKGFDVAAFIKREVNKSRRELFLMLHKTHYVCLLAHLTHLDTLLSSPLLKAMGLSLVPLAHGSTPPTKLTLIGLGALVSWLRGAVPVNKHLDASPPTRSFSALMRSMQTMLAMDNTELVLVFVLICRSIGLATRLVLNFAILPLKPKGDGGMTVFETAKDHKPGPENNSKSEESQSMSRSKESLSSKLSKAASLNGKTECSLSGSDKKQKHEKDFKQDKRQRAGKGKDSSKRKGIGRRPSGSDEEGENDAPQGKYHETSSKKEKRSLSAKLADAAKARLSPCVVKEPVENNLDQKKGRKEKGRMTRSLNEVATLHSRSVKDDRKQKAGERGNRQEESSHKRELAKGTVGSSGSSRQAGSKTKAGLDVRDYWAEVYLPKEKRWIVVDLMTGSVNHPEEIESRCSKPVTYCLAVNEGKVKDITAR